jgi:phage tail sheath protein FI
VSEFLSPGVYIEEINSGGQTVQAVGTSTMATVGWTTRGPTNQALLVTGPDSYSRTFGDQTEDSLIPLSVSAFFTNGGTRCYVVRVAPTDALAAVSAITQAVLLEDPTTAAHASITPAQDGTSNGPFTIQFAHFPLTADPITITWTSTGSKTATITGTNVIGGANASAVSSANLDRVRGILTITFSTSPPAADSIHYSYNYAMWPLVAANVGAWGNNMLFTLSGNDNYFVYGVPGVSGAGSFTKFDVSISIFDTVAQQYNIVESYDELSFTDSSDPTYAPLVINDASNYVVITDDSAEAVPASFTGVTYTAESVGSGNGTLKTFSHTSAHFPIVQVSPVLHYTIGAVAKTSTPDASGVFSGTDFDATKTNSINYTTGVITLNFVTAPDNSSTITVDYIAMPLTSSVNYSFALGSDGTLTLGSGTFGRNVFTSPTLQPDKFGMYALDRVDEMMQLVIPDWAGNTVVQGDQIDYAEGRRDIFNILSTPKGYSAQQAVDYVRITFNRTSKYAALYWPWITVADPLQNNRSITMPPMAHIAGVYARTDLTKNVGKSPAGTVDGALLFLTGLEHNPDKGERDTVSPARINSLINTPQTGMAVWGVRTLSADSAWKYINAVRLFMFVEKSVYNSTFQFVFENIGQTLYSQIKTQLDGFLGNLFSQGYFAGTTPSQAFSTKCDGDNNPPEVVDAGQVVCDVALAPNKPGEFIRFRFQQQLLTSS